MTRLMFVAIVLALGGTLEAQSLGDAAKKAEEARTRSAQEQAQSTHTARPPAKKVYTNADLKTDGNASPAKNGADPVPPTPPAGGAPEAVLMGDGSRVVRDEA